jgi:hypothetical protein
MLPDPPLGWSYCKKKPLELHGAGIGLLHLLGAQLRIRRRIIEDLAELIIAGICWNIYPGCPHALKKRSSLNGELRASENLHDPPPGLYAHRVGSDAVSLGG